MFYSAWTEVASSRWWIGIAMSSNGQYQSAVAIQGYIYRSFDYGSGGLTKYYKFIQTTIKKSLLINNNLTSLIFYHIKLVLIPNR